MKAYRLQGMVVLPFPNSFYGNAGTKFPKKAERPTGLYDGSRVVVFSEPTPCSL